MLSRRGPTGPRLSSGGVGRETGIHGRPTESVRIAEGCPGQANAVVPDKAKAGSGASSGEETNA